MRIVFMGTPEFAVPALAEILSAGHDVAAVYTQPPRPAGRGMEARKSPVQLFAESGRIPVMTPKSLKGAAEQETFRAHAADVGVVVAYGLILPKPILDAPLSGCLNLHASALPRWRGAAPIQRAIMAGDSATAVMVMRMDEGLDTGPVCLAERVPIGRDSTAGELHDALARIGAGLMVRALAAIERGSLDCTPQPQEGVSYAAKIEKSEARIDFERPAIEVHNLIRALSPFPGAWFEAGPPGRTERVKVLRSELAEGSGRAGTILDGALTIACGEGAIRLAVLQRAGRRPVSADEFLRGFALTPGTRLGSPQ
ncbi:MAG: methionyl-tRNA formyltransferase [Hyphomicrobiaceae bacterium]|nr:methionyl-tRNA formyltransferase [Hyphomicrobiaceae bacterium]